MNNNHDLKCRLLPWLALTFFCLLPVSLQAVEKQRLEAVSAIVKEAVDQGKLAGVVTLVAQDEEVELFEAYGHRDLENKKPMTKDSIFRIFSMTKPIAGTALMTLWDDGKFKLDDPVAKYIPEFKDMKVADGVDENGNFKTVKADHPMTIRELMSHTGGLVYTPDLSRGPVAEAYGKVNLLDRNSTLVDMAEKLSKIPLNHQPGTRWVYSVSVDVQGYLVEVLSGKAFDVFLEERIFKPLGMKDTAFYVSADKADRLSRLYTPEEGGVLTSEPNGPYLEKPKFFSGGGGLTSTASDYLKFAQMHLNSGELDGVRILSEEAAKLMRDNHLPEGIDNIGPFYPGNAFGLDFAVVNDSKAAGLPEGTAWWWGIAGTWFWIDPSNDIVFIGMIQNSDLMYSRQLQAKVRQAMYGDL